MGALDFWFSATSPTKLSVSSRLGRIGAAWRDIAFSDHSLPADGTPSLCIDQSRTTANGAWRCLLAHQGEIVNACIAQASFPLSSLASRCVVHTCRPGPWTGLAVPRFYLHVKDGCRRSIVSSSLARAQL